MREGENVHEMLLRKQTAEHLWNIGNFLSSACPPASRFHMCTLERKLNEFPDLIKKVNKMYCRHCGSIWNSENCRIKILSRPHSNRHLAKLQKIEADKPWTLNKRQKQKLRKFYDSKSKIVYNCLSCTKKTIFLGSNIIKHKAVDSRDSSRIKLKKSDVTAGLFIPSPCSRKNNLEESLVINTSAEEIPLLNKSASKFKDEVNSPKNQTPPSTKKSSEISSNSQKQSTGKNRKKKTLLGQILNQEQNVKKKISLSSFLVSL